MKWIYIEEGEKVYLPKKFHSRHNVCVELYDLTLLIGQNKKFKDLRITKFNIHPDQKDALVAAERHGIEGILNHLTSTNQKSIVVDTLAKNAFSAILADVLKFIHESLSCAKRGHITVAFNLLRKPLTDDLLLLEQLFIDKNDLIERLHFEGNPRGYDPSPGKVGQDKLKSIVNGAIQKLGSLSTFFNENVFEFRYDKTSMAGFNWITNQAHHIVTTDKNYTTPEKSLNFVFVAGKQKLNEYWEHYYRILPYLLIYLSAIVDGFARSNIKVTEEIFWYRDLKRIIAIGIWLRGTKKRKFFRLITVKKIICKKCKSETSITEADYMLFFNTEFFICPNCFSDLLRFSDLKTKIDSLVFSNQ